MHLPNVIQICPNFLNPKIMHLPKCHPNLPKLSQFKNLVFTKMSSKSAQTFSIKKSCIYHSSMSKHKPLP
jgi:hypothetical protein